MQDAENDRVINVHVSDRPRAREGESFEQQGTFVQCTSSEKLSAVGTLERVLSINISHDDRGHANLTVVLLSDGFDGARASRRFCAIQLSISSVPTRSQLSSSKFASQLLGMRGLIICFATREAGTSYK